MEVGNIVKLPMKTAFRMASRIGLMLRSDEYRYVFILGHMRSGSTLLAHILANHADVVGAGETHIAYRTPADLETLVLKTCEFLRKPLLRETYVVDQINHDYVADEVLFSPRLYKCIILVREPSSTLKSMAALKGLVHAQWRETAGLKNYLNRLETLAHYGMILRDRALLVEYDNLIDHSEETLARITSFLGLKSPLRANYETHRMTARVAGIGDPSDNIRLGQIMRTTRHQIDISDDTLAAATDAFQSTRATIQAAVTNAVTIFE